MTLKARLVLALLFLLLITGGALANTDAANIDTVAREVFWHDHGAVVMLLAADFFTLVMLLVITVLHRARFNKLKKHCTTLQNEMRFLTGVAEERRIRIKGMEGTLHSLRERTIQLRSCDEDHEHRLVHIEEKFRLAHDTAVARIALRGDAWKDDDVPE